MSECWSSKQMCSGTTSRSQNPGQESCSTTTPATSECQCPLRGDEEVSRQRGGCFPLLKLSSDLALRCWPGRHVVMGLKVSKKLRELLRWHPHAIIRTSHARLVENNSFVGLGSQLHTNFNNQPQLYIDVQQLRWTCGDGPEWNKFQCFFAEFQHARSTGWRGPCQLELEGRLKIGSCCPPTCTIAGPVSRTLCASLANLQALTTLELAGLSFDSESAESLFGSVLETLPVLSAVSLCQVILPEEGMKSLTSGLGKCTGIRSLQLHTIPFRGEAADRLASTLMGLSSLTQLGISRCELRESGAEKMAGALQGQHHLQTLALGGNRISLAGAQAVASALGGYSSLQTLKLGTRQTDSSQHDDNTNHFLRDSGLLLAASLQRCPFLTALSLAEDVVTAEDGARAAELLLSCSRLTRLEVASCEVSEEGLMAMAQSFPHLGRLTSLSLDNLGVKDSRCSLLLHRRLSQLPALQTLSSRGSMADNAQALMVLADCHHLRSLHLEVFEAPSPAHLEQYASTLPCCSLLRSLQLDFSQLDDHCYWEAEGHDADAKEVIAHASAVLQGACAHIAHVDTQFPDLTE